MNKTAIEWCDMTWNPVTGCLHGCEYCYARNQTKRFGGYIGYVRDYGKNGLHEIDVSAERKTRYGDITKASFPFYFEPTFHRYRLGKPQRVKKPQNIFVCSMADLLGEWVPDEWIRAAFEACEAAPQHRYLFLTKNPGRYLDLQFKLPLPTANNFWYGFSHTGGEMFGLPVGIRRFVSIEPLLGEVTASPFTWNGGLDWVIIGAQTGPGSKVHQPKREWLDDIVAQSRAADVPVFMKNSLLPIWGEPLIQEFPWDKEAHP